MLNLAPEIESSVREYAAQEGVSINDLMARHFPPKGKPQSETPEQTKQRVFGLLAKWQREAGLPQPIGGSKTLAELSAEWAAEDANMTKEEIASERAFWEERERNFDKRPGISI